MQISLSSLKDAELLAHIVCLGNKDVAKKFNFTRENAPKHPSFCTEEWIESDLERGQIYFLCRKDGVPMGCVAFELADPTTAYLNRLSVLPEYRGRGVGKRLVEHILQYAYERGAELVSIGIIAAHEQLKNWYLKLGFVEVGMKRFDHLPFDVLYLQYTLKKQ